MTGIEYSYFKSPYSITTTTGIRFSPETARPTTTCSLLGTTGLSGWYRSEVRVTLNPSDTGGSGLKQTMYSIDGGPEQVYGGPFNITTNGPHDLMFYSIDNMDNREAVDNHQPVWIDFEVPDTNMGLSGTMGFNDWYTGDVTVTFNYVEAVSGIALTKYTLNGGAEQTYTPPLVVGTEGTTLVAFYSQDVAGNAEGWDSGSFKIDKTAPVTVATPDRAANANDWYNAPVTYTFGVTETGSGQNHTWYRINSGEWIMSGSVTFDTDGTYLLEFYSNDNAGNNGPIQSTTVKLDQAKPSCTYSLIGTPGISPWWVSEVQVNIGASDPAPASGVDYIEVCINGINWVPYTGPFNITTQGDNLIQFRAVDRASNTEITHTIQICIDSVGPECDIEMDGNLNNGWYKSNVLVTLYWRDPTQLFNYGDLSAFVDTTDHSGVWYVEYKLNNDAWKNYTVPFWVKTEGINTVLFRAIDNAGNVGTLYTQEIKVDKSDPWTEYTLTGNGPRGGWFNSSVELNLTAYDTYSGVDKIRVDINDGHRFDYNGTIVFTQDGVYKVDFRAVDNATRHEEWQTIYVCIDTNAPATTCMLDGTHGLGGWFISDVNVTLEALDYGEVEGLSTLETIMLIPANDYSGVDYIEYSWDGSGWTTYGPGFFTVTEGMHTLYYRAVDLAGNFETYQTEDINIDTTLPFVTGTDPVADYVYAVFNSSIYIYFNEDMYADSFDADSIRVVDWNGFDVPGTITVTGSTAVFDPTNDFGPNFEYTVTVSGDVMDTHGNMMGADYVWEFKAQGLPQNPWHYRNTDDQSGLNQTVIPSPTVQPTVTPTVTPTVEPTITPTPTVEPTATPTPEPTGDSMPMYLGILIIFLGIVAVAGAAVYFLVFRKQ